MINYNLRGKNAIVTGVSRKKGIGSAICKALADSGANVFTSYFRSYDQTMSWGSIEEDSYEIIEELKNKGVLSSGVECDFRDPDNIQKFLNEAEKFFGRVDILINNATSGIEGDVMNLNSNLLDEAYFVNMRATMLLSSEFSKRYDGNPGGRIIILTSGQGNNPMPTELPYITTKGALETFTKSASITLAKKNITINAVDPGATDSGWMSKELYEQLKANNPMNRVGTPEDAARIITFLASEDARWITGQVIRSNGGGS